MNPANYNRRTIINKSIRSTRLEADRNLWIYLPPGYNEVLSYPLVLCQDGKEFLNFGRIATITNYLIMEENIIPPIIVGVEVDLERRTMEYSPDGSRFQRYCDFLLEEVLPLVEQEYPVRTGPDDMILAGDSLGATLSLHLTLDHPERFRKVLSLSGAFRNSTLDRLSTEEDLSFLDLYQVIGTDETAVKTEWGEVNILELNRKAKALLLDKQARVAYKENAGKHIWGFWQNELPDALKHFLQE